MMVSDLTGWRSDNRRLFWAICFAQVLLIAAPFVINNLMAALIVVTIVSVIALVGSITTAIFYLCLVSAIVPTWFYHDYLMLPLDFHFYEGLFVVVVALAGLFWLGEGRLDWRRRTRLDRPMLLLLGLIVFSCLIGFLHGHSTSQMLRDVRYPLYYALFFVVTWFFDTRKALPFLYLVVGAAAIVGVEYIIEFLAEVNLAIGGGFFRVARLEGIMLPMGVLCIGAILLYDTQIHRRVLGLVALLPIGLALVLTVGRGMWISLIFGILTLGILAVLDAQRTDSRFLRLIQVLGVPLVILGTAYFFQQQTGAGISDVAGRRISRAATRYEEDHSVAGRLVAYLSALNEIRRRPILGGGHGAVVYVASYENPQVVELLGAVDNLYLTIGLRMGLLGIAAFVGSFVYGSWRAFRLFQQTADARIRLFCAAFIAVYSMMLIYAMLDATMFANRLIFIHATFLGLIARIDYSERFEK